MAIKNWTVTAETVNNAAAREIYFSDENHKNHVNTEGFIDVFGSERQTLEIIHRAEKRRLKMSKARKGGRPPKAASEFVVSVPKGQAFRPSEEQWRLMLKGLMSDAAEHLKVKGSALMPIVRAYAHQQVDDGKDKGAGDHMHIMIGHYDLNGDRLDLNRLSFLFMLKNSWNLQVKKQLGICNTTYEAKRTYGGVAKKRTSQWRVNAAREREAIAKERKLATSDRAESVRLCRDSREKNTEMTMVLIPEFRRLSEKAEKQLKALNDYIKAGNMSRVGSTLNRLEKTSTEIGHFAGAFIDDNKKEAVLGFQERLDSSVKLVKSELLDDIEGGTSGTAIGGIKF